MGFIADDNHVSLMSLSDNLLQIGDDTKIGRVDDKDSFGRWIFIHGGNDIFTLHATGNT